MTFVVISCLLISYFNPNFDSSIIIHIVVISYLQRNKPLFNQHFVLLIVYKQINYHLFIFGIINFYKQINNYFQIYFLNS